MSEKRQRVGTSPTDVDAEDLASYMAQATEKPASQFAPVQSAEWSLQAVSPQYAMPNTQEGTRPFISDPYLYMRILSLPMLESLVRGLDLG